MIDGAISETHYDLYTPDWYNDCVSYLNKEELNEYKNVLVFFLNTSATKDEILQVIKHRSVSILFNIVAMDIEEQAAKQQPQRIRNSQEYKDWRKAVFERDNYTCQSCGKHGGKLNAHHIKPFKDYPKLRLVLDNGITLCAECHKEAHKKAV